MQKKKIFIEIEVPESLKKRLFRITEKWQHFPIKWAKSESLHITVAFIGFVDEEVIPEICQKVTEACEKIESFDLDFDKFHFSPDIKNPRAVFFSGEANEGLRMLNEAIEESLGMNKHAHKEFKPHITLGRVRKAKWDEFEVKPVIDEKFHAVISVDYVSIMESKGGGAEYVSLEQCPLA